MKISGINSNIPVSAQKKVQKAKINSNNSAKAGRYNVISLSEYMARPLSFRGRNKEQAIFYGAEVAPFSKAGGVGVVMKDYGFLLDPKDEVVVSPYYRADVDKVTGEVTPKKNENGDYILETGDGPKVLDLVAEKNMQWGNRRNNKIMLFNLRDEKDKVHYFVFDDSTAHYPKPYAGGQVYASGSKAKTNAWNGDPYAKNSRAFVELLPELINSKEGFNPATIVCSDSQTAYTHEYMVQKAVSDKDYDEIKTTHVGHNLGSGYCGETSMQNMFVNLGATPEQIELIEKDPMYSQGILGDKYFEPFVSNTLDATGTASATQIALHHAKNGFVKSFSVVAEDYAHALATNPQAAYNIYSDVKELYHDGTFNGILNPLEDASIDPTKDLPNPLYNVDCEDTDGTVFEAFEKYPSDVNFEEMRAIKNRNKLRLLERFSAKDISILTGTKGRKANINPEAEGVYSGPIIREDLLKLVKEGKGDQVPLFISWGRIDTQKGHDISLSAFEKFAKTEEGKNAIFILGAGLDGGAESKRIEAKLKELFADPELQGRIIHIDGWAPAYAMASASDAAVFTSRFEPCGLTDIEAMKYYCNPIVANTQGFKQKNFDPRNPDEAKKATSFKTTHEFDLLSEQVDKIIDAYVNNDEDAKKAVQEEFPVFWTEEDGQRVYDDSVFVKFAEEYTEFIDAKKKELLLESTDGTLPDKWDNWDELSKEYSFKYAGFARDLKDAVLAAETTEAIKQYVLANNDTKSLMFSNLKKLNTGWKGNAGLHPTNESSYELYRNRHLLKDYTKPTKEDVIAKDDKFITDKMEERQTDDLKYRLKKYLPSGVAVVTALLVNLKKTKDNKNLEMQLNSKIKELETQIANHSQELKEQATKYSQELQSQAMKLAKVGKKNMIIAGVLSAVAASAITVGVLKKIQSKKKTLSEENEVVEKKEMEQSKVEQPKVETTPVSIAQTQLKPEAKGVFANFV